MLAKAILVHGVIGYKFCWLLPDDQNQGTPVGHESAETPIGNVSMTDQAKRHAYLVFDVGLTHMQKSQRPNWHELAYNKGTKHDLRLIGLEEDLCGWVAWSDYKGTCWQETPIGKKYLLGRDSMKRHNSIWHEKITLNSSSRMQCEKMPLLEMGVFS